MAGSEHFREDKRTCISLNPTPKLLRAQMESSELNVRRRRVLYCAAVSDGASRATPDRVPTQMSSSIAAIA